MSVEGATHRQVVELIKSCGDTLTLTVISVSEDEAERLEPTGEKKHFNFRFLIRYVHFFALLNFSGLVIFGHFENSPNLC